MLDVLLGMMHAREAFGTRIAYSMLHRELCHLLGSHSIDWVFNVCVMLLQTVPSMALQRAYSAAAAIDGRIIIAGGMAHETCRVEGFEIYDPNSSTWADLSIPLERKEQRPFLAACALPRHS